MLIIDDSRLPLMWGNRHIDAPAMSGLAINHKMQWLATRRVSLWNGA